MRCDRVGAYVGAGVLLACLPAAVPAGMRTEGFSGPPSVGSGSGTREPAVSTEAKGAAEKESSPEGRSEPRFTGKVLLIRGGEFVAEVAGGVRKGDRLVFCDGALRACTEGTVTRALDREVYLLKRTRGSSPAVGYHLAQTPAQQGLGGGVASAEPDARPGGPSAPGDR